MLKNPFYYTNRLMFNFIQTGLFTLPTLKGQTGVAVMNVCVFALFIHTFTAQDRWGQVHSVMVRGLSKTSWSQKQESKLFSWNKNIARCNFGNWILLRVRLLKSISFYTWWNSNVCHFPPNIFSRSKRIWISSSVKWNRL